MIPNLTNQYISYSMAVFSANEIRTFLLRVEGQASPSALASDLNT